MTSRRPLGDLDHARAQFTAKQPASRMLSQGTADLKDGIASTLHGAPGVRELGLLGRGRSGYSLLGV
jgi:hypothetical protein